VWIGGHPEPSQDAREIRFRRQSTGHPRGEDSDDVQASQSDVRSLSVTAENLPSLKTDVWILVNWTHEIEPAELRSILQNILGQHTTDDGCLIIDSVPPGIGRYQHDPGSLVAGMECSVCRLGGDYPFDRALYVITRGERPVQSA